MEYRILGPLAVAKDGSEVVIGSGKQRAILVLLVLHANEAVSTDRLVDQLWGEPRSTSATKVLQNYVSKLRRLLGDGVLITRPHGYELRVEPGELDADLFDDLVAEGRRALAAGDPERAAAVLAEALSLWRGPPLADFAYEPFASAEIDRLEGLRLAALTERIDADLQLGRHDALIGELETLVARYPLQERLRGQLMLALYRSGRQADALRVYKETRRVLVDELGIEPSQELQRLEHAILVHDP
jgi:DNA-binding SARP family transcriptional activator